MSGNVPHSYIFTARCFINHWGNSTFLYRHEISPLYIALLIFLLSRILRAKLPAKIPDNRDMELNLVKTKLAPEQSGGMR